MEADSDKIARPRPLRCTILSLAAPLTPLNFILLLCRSKESHAHLLPDWLVVSAGMRVPGFKWSRLVPFRAEGKRCLVGLDAVRMKRLEERRWERDV